MKNAMEDMLVLRQPRARLRALQARQKERGATIFVVLTVMTLLTAVGVYAARAASLVDRAAGFDRQFVQTQYVSSLGALSTAGLYGSSSAPSALGQDTCGATLGVAPNTNASRCSAHSFDDIQNWVQAVTTGQPLLDQAKVGPPVIPGSLGPFTTATGSALEGYFTVEVSDAGNAGMAQGEKEGSSGYTRVTLTAIGMVRPFTGIADDTCVDGAAAVTGIERTRVFLEYGPNLSPEGSK